ncbi:hypothetical protein EW146_g3034 [Bondarzewia mesenterica]|uniref:DUF7082 domain-containing protein n=1 Tax=Bondarzewia mesenterica TaxID=1095465 RepID=A0A4S4LYU5_9AGAM|nr:hypothetical protein EW146_g3034 [Bondarzewia mesenterica]
MASNFLDDSLINVCPPRSPNSLNVANTSAAMPYMAVSAMGMLRVLEYTPREGEQGIPITVHTRFRNTLDPSRNVYLRLVIGTTPIQTRILHEDERDGWRLEGAIPRIEPHRGGPPIVSVVVQVLSSKNEILDTVETGKFTYWRSDTSPQSGKDELQLLTPELSRHSLSPPFERKKKRAHKRAHSAVSGSPAGTKSSRQRSRRARLTPQPRHRQVGEADTNRPFGRPELVFTSPLETITHNFTDEELRAGRRLVRFSRIQDGNQLRVSFKFIRADEYHDGQVVVSCICRAEDYGHYITSVDIISLLQYLVQCNFSIEEKNRIRRNLEGFRPVTISKSRPETMDFFQQIMEFPMPKPRRIEKDVKVFDWSVLGAALEKIVTKYSLVGLSDLLNCDLSVRIPTSNHPVPTQDPHFPPIDCVPPRNQKMTMHIDPLLLHAPSGMNLTPPEPAQRSRNNISSGEQPGAIQSLSPIDLDTTSYFDIERFRIPEYTQLVLGNSPPAMNESVSAPPSATISHL